jgi:autotransporter-associated beta strand protein
MKRLFPVVCLFSCLLAAQLFAGSATWNLNPTSGDWNTAENWTPNTVPNSTTDIATFGTSSVTEVSLSGMPIFNIGSLLYLPGANEFTIHTLESSHLLVYGDGMVNGSGGTQQFVVDDGSSIQFQKGSAGDATNYLVSGGVSFSGMSSAATANFTVMGSVDFFYCPTRDCPTAADATFNVLPGGFLSFTVNTTAANATIANAGGIIVFTNDASAADSTIVCSKGALIYFNYAATAGNAEITAEGGTSSDNTPGLIHLFSSSTGGNATFVVEGGDGDQALGANMTVTESASTGNAEVIVNGGTNGGAGGQVRFAAKSDGGTSRFILSGNATFGLSNHGLPPLTVGSIEGEGTLLLGPSTLQLGNNNLDTTFSGTIENGVSQAGPGRLNKIGTGTLTLSGSSTYSGGTIVSSGGLIISNATGSATGAGSVTVEEGTLGGEGKIAGPTTIGTGTGAGGFLQPSKGANSPTALTIQNTLTFKGNSTYIWKLNTNKAKADTVIASGITIETGAQFSFNTVANKKLIAGRIFTALSNTSASPISGTFANLADNSTFTAGQNTYQASYSGGDGNDLTLTVVP